MCKESNYTSIAASFDAFSFICPYFTTKPWVNNGYGCIHPDQEERRHDGEGNECGACYLSSCPLGHSADADDLNNPDIDWGGDKPDADDVSGEYIIVRTDNAASDAERTAADQYLRYINRYSEKKEDDK